MKDKIAQASVDLKHAIQRVNPTVRKEADRIRQELTHTERYRLSRLMNQARDSGVTLTALGEWYGTKDRRTITELVEYMHQTQTSTDEFLADYLEVSQVNEDQVEIRTARPVPLEVWKSNVSSSVRDLWEGSIITDGVMTSEANALWLELKQTDLPEQLGLEEMFSL